MIIAKGSVEDDTSCFIVTIHDFFVSSAIIAEDAELIAKMWFLASLSGVCYHHCVISVRR